ncbi:DUF1772 domain-containing protein [Nocardiopsis ansamitocini]|uniref:Membrane protein n=1 Tax=Nocardiopsis ansamitocini TaxID=1670832 RepID=A0A9W6PBG6_9ACTN|nr:anthrone oxygenase family protein [Nocardiopsis ansamitocini]GLU50472.1 membrane protein [Nocardiopsis ansamitocini]
MTDGPQYALVLLCALANGLVAGVFFAFSSFVMKALAALPPETGMAAMRSINTAAVTPVFMTLFLGTTVLSVGTAVWGLTVWGASDAAPALVGGGLALAGFLVTAAANVPRNNALADDRADQGYWRRYLTEWTAWNHVRTVLSLAASASFIFATAG